MKPVTPDTDDREPVLLPPHGRPPAIVDINRMPCSQCKAPTLRSTLAQYGARCFRCYESYCQGSGA